MKFGKKVLAFLLTLVLLASLGAAALAEDPDAAIVVEEETETEETAAVNEQPEKMKVKCQDTEGITIRDTEDDYLDLSKDQVLDGNTKRPEIPGYTYVKTMLNKDELTKLTVSHTGEDAVITAVIGEGESAVEKTLSGSETLIFVYEKKAAEHVHAWDEGKVTKEASCTEAGEKTFHCACGESKTEEIPALGHDWGEAVYAWTEDNSACVASRTCKRDASHTESETAKPAETVTKEAKCTEAGEKSLKAVFTNKAFAEQSKTAAIPALGHDWGEPSYAWTEDNSACVASRACKRDASHTESETAKPVETVTKEASCTEAGEKTLSASFSNTAFAGQNKTVEIPALGHDYAHGRCKRCGTADPDFKPKLSDGTNGHASWGTDYKVSSDAAYKDFQKVLIDGAELSASEYKVAEKDGNTQITVKGETIKKLKVGEHKIAVVSATGTAERRFSVSDKPKTGDGSTALWVGLLSISALGCGAILTARKRFGMQ